MKVRRRHQRFIRRLQIEFTAYGQTYVGISSDFSLSGLFIRTNHAFAPGTVVDLVVYLPDGIRVTMRGSVRRAFKTPVVALKNGMGVELTEKDPRYIDFINSFSADDEEDEKAGASRIPPVQGLPVESVVIPCPQCGARNRVSRTKLSLGPRCGRCRTILPILQ